jgi:hypothetical protein
MEHSAVNDWRDHKPGRWAAYDLMDGRTRLPRFAGAYALYIDGRLVYVGQSCDIANRFSEHAIRLGYAKNIHTPWGTFPDTTAIVLKVKRSRVLGDWAMWEIRLIRRLRPQFNDRLRGRKLKVAA